jgi:aspergillopepsin I
MIKKKLIPPIFSVALNRSHERPGALALGGLPGPNIKHTSDWVKVPMQYLKFSLDSNDPQKPNDYQFYVIEASGWEVPRVGSIAKGADPNTRKLKMILDTGSTLTQLPDNLVMVINGGNAWNPPAWRSSDTGQWMVKCNATPPKLGMRFGNKTLYFGAEDMIFMGKRDLCVSGIQPGNAAIAGGSFLKNILAVFDVGGAEIRLAQRIR